VNKFAKIDESNVYISEEEFEADAREAHRRFILEDEKRFS
jgi:hypothetical protein